MVWSKFRCQGHFSIRLASEAIDMYLRGTGLHLALESQDLEVLVVAFQEDLCLGSCPLRVVRHLNAPYSPDELGDAQEGLLHAQGLCVHPLHQVLTYVLEEDDCQLLTQGLPFIGPVFSPSQGLVFCDVQDHRGVAGQPVHEPLLEDVLEVVSPSNSEGPTNSRTSNRSWTKTCRQNVPSMPRQVESLEVQER